VTLRSRLVAALVGLVALGLIIFGITTYGLYSRSQYQRLDDQVTNSLPLVSRQLTDDDQQPQEPKGDSRREGAQPIVVPLSTYGALIDSTGAVVATKDTADGAAPALPDDLVTRKRGDPFTVESASGSGSWRVLVGEADRVTGNSVLVAIPTTEVTAALRRLVLIEALASVVLLALLASGAWLILRRGLRPLEKMAISARSISAGDLSMRVPHADDRTEVGQLGLALNTMLGEIEDAFRERDATEQRLRQFLADASHELRTPLTSIQGFAELFRLGADSDHVNLAVILRRIEEESARMKTLVEDLLLLARLDETRSPERATVDLSVLAADACSDAVAAAPTRRVTLDAPEPVVVLGVEDHLRQALANLMSNAVRHTDAATPIDVATRVENGVAVMTVRDHGTGLDEEALAHVFDRFWQADAARAGTGAGLGLSIVAAIAAEHGGTARAANAPDGGALFTLTLPIEAA
jgi:two-component system OmpR family sensor kinase